MRVGEILLMFLLGVYTCSSSSSSCLHRLVRSDQFKVQIASEQDFGAFVAISDAAEPAENREQLCDEADDAQNVTSLFWFAHRRNRLRRL